MKQHVLAVVIRLPDDITVDQGAEWVQRALAKAGYEVAVLGGARTVSNLGEHLNPYRQKQRTP